MFVRRQLWPTLVAVGLLIGLLGQTAPAHAFDFFTDTKDLYAAPDGTPVPHFRYDPFGNADRPPSCPTYPGITMGGNIVADAHISTNTRVKLKFKLWTRYNEFVAIAKSA